MKDSGIEWIGEIPESWGITRIGNYYSFSSGDTLTNEKISDEGDYVVYGANGIRGFYNKYNLSGQHILIGRVGALCGNIHITNSDVWVTEHALICYSKTNVCNPYFGYVFSAMNLGQYSKASAQPVISSDTISRLRMPIPSQSEQQSISAYLDRQCGLIDSVIEKTKASIEEYKKLRQAVITQAVTKGVRGDRPMKDSGIEWIGEIPEEWKVFRIGALYSERKEQGNDELPILTVSINTGVSDRELADDETARIFVRSEDRSKYMRVYPGDLTYNMMRAWQGAFGAVRVDGMVSPAYVIAKPEREIDSRYMEALLRTPAAKEEMKRYSHGIADFRLRLYWEKFKYLKICFPPVSEQKIIADYIDSKCTEIDTLITKKEQFLTELEAYKKSLIYEYVTGKKEVPQA